MKIRCCKKKISGVKDYRITPFLAHLANECGFSRQTA